MYFVYLTTNLVNGKKYIGQHDGLLNDDYLGSGALLKQAISKYGKENFQREILEVCDSKEELDLAEKKWIANFNATENREFYNIAEGGTGGNTYKGLSEEELNRIKALRSEQTKGKNNPRFGQHMAEESKEKMRATFKERGVSVGENNPMYGKLGKDNPNSVRIYTIIDGEMRIFNGVREAGRIMNIHSPNISKSLTSNGHFSAGKSPSGQRLHWFYYDKEP